MKTIKFKGLRLDGKGWVYGDFINSLEYGAMIMLTAHCGGNSFDEAPSDYQDSVQVKPETVGQFTGLHDDNGVAIYEGDLFRCGTVGEIKFKNGRFIYDYKHLEDPEELDLIEVKDGEVIGNIHEK